MRSQGLKTVLMAGDALADKEFATITGPDADGVLFTFGPDPRKQPTAAAIVKKFKDKNIDPEGYTLYTYAAFQIWSQAVAKAGTTDAKKVADTIKAGSWDTVHGPIATTRRATSRMIDYAVYKWDQNGNYDELPAGRVRESAHDLTDRPAPAGGGLFCFSRSARARETSPGARSSPW